MEENMKYEMDTRMISGFIGFKVIHLVAIWNADSVASCSC